LRDGSQVHVRALGRNVAFDYEGLVIVVAAGRQHAGQCGGCDAWQFIQLPQQFAIEGVHLGLRRILLLRQRIGSRGDVVRSVTQVDGPHFFEAAKQQARGCEQNQGNCDFGDYKSGSQARVATAFRAASAAFFQVGVDVGSHRREGWREPADQASDNTQRERETDYVPVQANLADARQALGKHALADAKRNRSQC
jgi:hypothetical protein